MSRQTSRDRKVRRETANAEEFIDCVREKLIGSPMEELMTEFVVVQEDSYGGDYYQGERQALYKDGVLVWYNSPNEMLPDIIEAVLGRDVPTIHVKLCTWEFPTTLESADWEVVG